MSIYIEVYIGTNDSLPDARAFENKIMITNCVANLELYPDLVGVAIL